MNRSTAYLWLAYFFQNILSKKSGALLWSNGLKVSLHAVTSPISQTNY